MKTAIIVNPKAGAGRVGRRWTHYNRAINSCFGPAEVRFTQAQNDATRLVRQSVREGFDRIVIIGGDGTLNESVNGLFSEDGDTFLGEAVSLVLYPAGTGGDFCRSLELSSRSLDQILQGATDRRIDLGRARYTAADGRTLSRHFINISSFGASGLIVDKVNHTSKLLGGRVSFMLGTLKGLLAYQNQRVRLTVDDHFDEEVLINTVAVANGRFFGGSMKIAPDAKLDDGLFDVVIIGDIDVGRFVRYSGRLYQGAHIGLPEIRVVRGRHVEATPVGEAPVLIDLDGEQPGRLPVRYDVVPRALKVYAPWERVEAVDTSRPPEEGRRGSGDA
jgi:YegS/Rv2252/BmrU family lipid kinase